MRIFLKVHIFFPFPLCMVHLQTGTYHKVSSISDMHTKLCKVKGSTYLNALAMFCPDLMAAHMDYYERLFSLLTIFVLIVHIIRQWVRTLEPKYSYPLHSILKQSYIGGCCYLWKFLENLFGLTHVKRREECVNWKSNNQPMVRR